VAGKVFLPEDVFRKVKSFLEQIKLYNLSCLFDLPH
jgi:hypothetical protein